ncbi:hypothetical protein TSOC_000743 [Tetrabaena socialis]|uniref:ABC-2 type transporter transmembrane domain-containing protein n=1 Tax=Tetrabaena socialis TaxID=47790 RepID=A0A2J8AII5_9CHLO|nr:hypothetical protein TSOC_000743 [Tetrabaena socialis]|eukprot:PNH12329.1 hypothetical protein TSOC_000743 [Tetrabaena socialis]
MSQTSARVVEGYLARRRLPALTLMWNNTSPHGLPASLAHLHNTLLRLRPGDPESAAAADTAAARAEAASTAVQHNAAVAGHAQHAAVRHPAVRRIPWTAAGARRAAGAGRGWGGGAEARHAAAQAEAGQLAGATAAQPNASEGSGGGLGAQAQGRRHLRSSSQPQAALPRDSNSSGSGAAGGGGGGGGAGGAADLHGSAGEDRYGSGSDGEGAYGSGGGGTAAAVRVRSRPLPPSGGSAAVLGLAGHLLLALMLGTPLCYSIGGVVVRGVQEAASGAKQQQLATRGCSALSYWLSSWCADMATVHLPAAAAVLAVLHASGGAQPFTGSAVTAAGLGALLAGFAAAALPWGYCIALRCATPAAAQGLVSYSALGAGVGLALARQLLSHTRRWGWLAARLLPLFRLLPPFCLLDGLLQGVFATRALPPQARLPNR